MFPDAFRKKVHTFSKFDRFACLGFIVFAPLFGGDLYFDDELDRESATLAILVIPVASLTFFGLSFIFERPWRQHD
jgi:hypothetical protein